MENNRYREEEKEIEELEKNDEIKPDKENVGDDVKTEDGKKDKSIWEEWNISRGKINTHIWNGTDYLKYRHNWEYGNALFDAIQWPMKVFLHMMK